MAFIYANTINCSSTSISFYLHRTACGGHLTATTRVKHFYSHARFGDNNYDNNADCDWTIEAEPGHNVQLTFLTFDVSFKCLT